MFIPEHYLTDFLALSGLNRIIRQIWNPQSVVAAHSTSAEKSAGNTAGILCRCLSPAIVSHFSSDGKIIKSGPRILFYKASGN